MGVSTQRLSRAPPLATRPLLHAPGLRLCFRPLPKRNRRSQRFLLPPPPPSTELARQGSNLDSLGPEPSVLPITPRANHPPLWRGQRVYLLHRHGSSWYDPAGPDPFRSPRDRIVQPIPVSGNERHELQRPDSLISRRAQLVIQPGQPVIRQRGFLSRLEPGEFRERSGAFITLEQLGPDLH